MDDPVPFLTEGARVLEELRVLTGAIPNRRDHIASTLQLPVDDVEVLLEAPRTTWPAHCETRGVIATLTTKGRMLMVALSD